MNIIMQNVTHNGFNEIAKHKTKLPGVGTKINPHHVLKEYYIQDGYLSTSCTKIIGLV
jgi:hypothetical protein